MGIIMQIDSFFQMQIICFTIGSISIMSTKYFKNRHDSIFHRGVKTRTTRLYPSPSHLYFTLRPIMLGMDNSSESKEKDSKEKICIKQMKTFHNQLLILKCNFVS